MAYLKTNPQLGIFHKRPATEKSPIPDDYDITKLGDSLNWGAAYPSAVPINVILDAVKEYGVTNKKKLFLYRDNVPYACRGFWNKYLSTTPNAIKPEMEADALCYREFYQNDEKRDQIIKQYYQYENQRHIDNFGTPFSAKSCKRLGIAGTKYEPAGACGNLETPTINTSKIPASQWSDSQIAQSAGISLTDYQNMSKDQKVKLINYIQDGQKQSGGFRLPKTPIPIPAFLALVAGGVGLAWLTSRKK